MTKEYSLPFVNIDELYRYIKCKGSDSRLDAIIGVAVQELVYKVCYEEVPVNFNGAICDFGDLNLSCQRDIFNLLQCEKKRCIYLNESLLMSPSKSVTAIMGIRE